LVLHSCSIYPATARYFRTILDEMDAETTLKRDLFGDVTLKKSDAGTVIVRNTASARWWVRWLARCLLRREAKALAALDGLEGVPALLHVERDKLVRSYISGKPLHRAKTDDIDWFIAASRLLRRIHRAGVSHNDLAKEPNLLVCDDGKPGIIDFQLAWHSPGRGRLFRIAAHEDLRHLLKHKRTYRADCLTRRERDILANPSLLSRAWMGTVKPVYIFVTRKLLGWADREGAGDRGSRN
jgi:RIO-like serine/threonine protein kinase